MKQHNSRRRFLKNSTYASTFLELAAYNLNQEEKLVSVDKALDEITKDRPSTNQSVMGLTEEPIGKVRIGIIGCGDRGLGWYKTYVVVKPYYALPFDYKE